MNILWYLFVWAAFFGVGFLILSAQSLKKQREELHRREEEERITVRHFRSLKAN